MLDNGSRSVERDFGRDGIAGIEPPVAGFDRIELNGRRDRVLRRSPLVGGFSSCSFSLAKSLIALAEGLDSIEFTSPFVIAV